MKCVLCCDQTLVVYPHRKAAQLELASRVSLIQMQLVSTVRLLSAVSLRW